MTLTFTCKDPLVAQYVDARFRSQFENQLARVQTAGGRELRLRAWRRRLTKVDGKPVLLVPTVVIDRDATPASR